MSHHGVPSVKLAGPFSVFALLAVAIAIGLTRLLTGTARLFLLAVLPWIFLGGPFLYFEVWRTSYGPADVEEHVGAVILLAAAFGFGVSCVRMRSCVHQWNGIIAMLVAAGLIATDAFLWTIELVDQGAVGHDDAWRCVLLIPELLAGAILAWRSRRVSLFGGRS